MMKLLFNPWVLLGLLLVLATVSGASYFKGRADGKQVEREICNEGREKAAAANLTIKEKQDAVRAHYPDTRALLKRLRDGSYP